MPVSFGEYFHVRGNDLPDGKTPLGAVTVISLFAKREKREETPVPVSFKR